MMCAIARIEASEYKPRHPCEIRPIRSTPVASITTNPGLALAMAVKWARCQSDMTPSLAEYWHIGATAMRLATVKGPSWSGLNKWVVINVFPDIQ